MFARAQFSLLLLFILSLFVASRSYDLPEVIELQRCQFRCLQRDLSTGLEHLCLVQCHQTYLQEHADRGNAEDPQIEDPKKQYEQCQRGCSRYEGTGQRRQKQYCLKECRDQYEEQRKQQEEREQRGGGGMQNDHQPGVSPEQKYRQCQQKCQSRKEVEERKSCQQRCKEEYSKEREREGEGREHGGDDNLLSKKKEEKHENNPYFFEEGKFESRFKTKEGHFRVLERFSEKSELLEGIDNYRLAVLEANPCTFVIPHHYDADAVFVVANGKGTITFVHQQQRESFNLQPGDAITVPAGSTVYLINRDNNEKLYILMVVHPINTPGHFEEFFGAGGEEPQSFYTVFSNELLEAALNTPKDKFERVFGRHKKGVIIKASREHIRALGQDQEAAGSSSQEEGGESRGPFNILQQQPLFSNEYGQFREASPATNEQLRRLDFSVAFMIINQGAMIEPYHNTRSTELVVVVGGKGKLEMACPHLGRQSHDSKGNKEKKHEKRSVQYQKISARLSVGDVFINPAGHPISIVSSGNENLKLVVFGVNARHNYKQFLAGGDNIWNRVQPEAKELSFESQATAVDEVFGSQEKSYFVPGPKQSQEEEEEKGHSVASSILDFVGLV